MTIVKNGDDMESRRHRRGGRLRILAYHAVADLRGDRFLAEYAVSPERFAAQLDSLLARGWEFVGLDAVLAARAGVAELPRRALLLSFDDAYADLLEVACPLLAERGIQALAFAVADRVGGVNEWDLGKGAGRLSLLDAAGLRAAAAAGVEIGSHTATHRALTRVPSAELGAELEGSADALAALGLPRPRAFSYPYGEATPGLADAVEGAGYEIAFTTAWGDPGRAPGSFLLPRVEVHASDTPARLRRKLALAGWPGPLRDGLLTLSGVRLDPSG